MRNFLDKETDWYILHSFKTNRPKISEYDELMNDKPVCNDLCIAILPNNEHILRFNWLKTIKYQNRKEGLGSVREICRQTSAITHTEINDKWLVFETLNSTYTFMKISSDEAFIEIIERLESDAQ